MPRRPDAPDRHEAGGTYAFRDQSPAARRSLMRTDQHYEDTGLALWGDIEAHEADYGRRDPGHSGYGSSGQGLFGRGGFAQGGQGQSGYGQDYGQRDPTRSDAATRRRDDGEAD